MTSYILCDINKSLPGYLICLTTKQDLSQEHDEFIYPSSIIRFYKFDLTLDWMGSYFKKKYLHEPDTSFSLKGNAEKDTMLYLNDSDGLFACSFSIGCWVRVMLHCCVELS